MTVEAPDPARGSLDVSEPTPLQERIEDAANTGAARFPPDPEPPKEVRTYDPKDVVVTFKGIEIKGYADGTFVEVERDEDRLPPVDHVPVNAKGTVSLTLFAMSENAEEIRWHAEIWRRVRKWAKRHALRARMRARKRRRGW